MVWQRARSAEQKAVRFKEILEAAYSLFEKESYEKISLNGIARCAGISKPNIYRYFCSREAIFLKIFEEEFMIWLEAVSEAGRNFNESSSCREVAETIADITAERKKLQRLAPYLMVSLEKHASFKDVYNFKKKIHEAVDDLFVILTQSAPHIFPEDAIMKFGSILAIIIGLSPMDFKSGTLKKVMEMPEFKIRQRSFRDVLADTLEVMFLGMERLETEREGKS